MKCETCGVDTGMYALSDKPDPGYGYREHTWEQCARALLGEAGFSSPSAELRTRIARLLAAKDERWDRVRAAISALQHVVK